MKLKSCQTNKCLYIFLERLVYEVRQKCRNIEGKRRSTWDPHFTWTTLMPSFNSRSHWATKVHNTSVSCLQICAYPVEVWICHSNIRSSWEPCARVARYRAHRHEHKCHDPLRGGGREHTFSEQWATSSHGAQGEIRGSVPCSWAVSTLWSRPRLLLMLMQTAKFTFTFTLRSFTPVYILQSNIHIKNTVFKKLWLIFINYSNSCT